MGNSREPRNRENLGGSARPRKRERLLPAGPRLLTGGGADTNNK